VFSLNETLDTAQSSNFQNYSKMLPKKVKKKKIKNKTKDINSDKPMAFKMSKTRLST